jgi:hypothetical protein
MRRIEIVLAAMAIAVSLGLAAWPQARESAAILFAQDDPVVLADVQLDARLRRDPKALQQAIDAALAENDPDLAASLLAIAADRMLAIPDELSARVTAAVSHQQSVPQIAKRFSSGFITGEADDLAGLSGSIAGDLFIYGDIRDVVREGKHMVAGEEVDHVMLGLAGAGIVATGATYAVAGSATPVRAGLTLVKDARRIGRLSEGLASWAGRSARNVIDAPALQSAVSNASLTRPFASAAGLKAAIKTEHASGLLRLAKDVGRVREKAGVKGAFDTLKIAQGPKDVARAVRLAESKGGQTRGFLRLLGRGALVLAAGAFQLAGWLFSGLMLLIGFLSAIKSGTERTTQWWLDRAKRKRAERTLRDASASAEGASPINLAQALAAAPPAV